VSVETPDSTFQTPTDRLIVLGASNVAIGLYDVVATAQATWRAPLDIMIAAGVGRAYSVRSRAGVRSISSIEQSTLWQALADRNAARSFALLTDIGNDLVYGVEVDQVVDSLDTCLSRLANRCERLAITALPMSSLRNIRRWQFLALKTFLFPLSRLDLRTLLGRAMLLNQQVARLANRYAAHIVKPCSTWYGWDPIHYRKRNRPTAWKKFFSPMVNQSIPSTDHENSKTQLRRHRFRIERKRVFGISIRRRQPTAQFDDGTTISLF
jgi:hypothetical protein